MPVQLVLCEKDRVVPARRFSRHFTDYLPPGTKVTKLDGVGHVPMFEAPERVTAAIADFIDECGQPGPTGRRPPAS